MFLNNIEYGGQPQISSADIAIDLECGDQP